MPVYEDPRIVKKVSVPSIAGSEVEIYNTLLWGDLEEIYSSELSDVAKARKALSLLIKSWNLTDKEGKALPITEDILKMFVADVITFLLSQTDFSPEGVEGVKKKT